MGRQETGQGASREKACTISCPKMGSRKTVREAVRQDDPALRRNLLPPLSLGGNDGEQAMEGRHAFARDRCVAP